MASPFGGGTFGQPAKPGGAFGAASGFGQPTAFGQQQPPAGGGGAFAKTGAAGFGQPSAFGQPAAPGGGGFGGFGQPASPGAAGGTPFGQARFPETGCVTSQSIIIAVKSAQVLPHCEREQAMLRHCLFCRLRMLVQVSLLLVCCLLNGMSRCRMLLP